jgi:hypothetical protein
MSHHRSRKSDLAEIFREDRIIFAEDCIDLSITSREFRALSLHGPLTNTVAPLNAKYARHLSRPFASVRVRVSLRACVPVWLCPAPNHITVFFVLFCFVCESDLAPSSAAHVLRDSIEVSAATRIYYFTRGQMLSPATERVHCQLRRTRR